MCCINKCINVTTKEHKSKEDSSGGNSPVQCHARPRKEVGFLRTHHYPKGLFLRKYHVSFVIIWWTVSQHQQKSFLCLMKLGILKKKKTKKTYLFQSCRNKLHENMKKQESMDAIFFYSQKN